VERAIEEQEVVRISMLDERQGLKDLKTSDIVDVKAAEHGDLVAGADKDAEDTRVVEGGETKEEVVTKEEEEEEEWIERARCASRQGHGVRGGEVAG